jgi:hypothetical protein
MQLLITRQTVAQRRIVRPGEVVEVSDSEARVLKGANKATEVAAAGKAPPPSPTRTTKRTKRTAP